MKFYFIFGDYFSVMLLKELGTILLCCSEKKHTPNMALFNLLGGMFLIIEVLLNEPLDGAVKSNFYLPHSVYARQFLSWQRESLEM